MTTITLRPAGPDDRAFIDGLSPRLSSVPRPAWHDLAAMERFQDRHMEASFAPVDGASTLIACTEDGRRLGYIHLRPAKDGVTDEPCGYVSLLATTPEAEGTGVARQLIGAAEDWARGRGYRLLSLDVFANNKRAVEF
jgi:GNAT superfamily N-acetyltransferase